MPLDRIVPAILLDNLP